MQSETSIIRIPFTQEYLKKSKNGKINGFKAQIGAYYTTITPLLKEP